MSIAKSIVSSVAKHVVSSVVITSGGSAPTGEWLLITGYWDNNGLWDDSSTWEDET